MGRGVGGFRPRAGVSCLQLGAPAPPAPPPSGRPRTRTPDASSPVRGNPPAHAGSAAPPPRTRIPASAPARPETQLRALWVGPSKLTRRTAALGAPVAGADGPDPDASSPAPHGFRSRGPPQRAPSAQPCRNRSAEGRVAPAVLGACRAGEGLESVGAGSCPLTYRDLYLRLFKASFSPSQLQAKGSFTGPWKQVNRSLGPRARLCSLSREGRRGVFRRRSLGDTYSDLILIWTGWGLPGRSGA